MENPDTTGRVSRRDSRLGALSLICLAAGVVGPFLTTLALPNSNAGQSLAGVNSLVIGFHVVCVLLALLLGIFSRRSRAGRVGLIGSFSLLAIGLILVLFLFFQPASRVVAPASSLPSPQ